MVKIAHFSPIENRVNPHAKYIVFTWFYHITVYYGGSIVIPAVPTASFTVDEVAARNLEFVVPELAVRWLKFD